MDGGSTTAGTNVFSRVTVTLGSAVAIVVILAWAVTWATSDLAMGLLGTDPTMGVGAFELATFFGIMVVMMVAMMLPAALPMVVAFHGLTRLEEGRPTKPPDLPATALFVSAYFLVWGAFAVLALFGLMALGVMGPLTGALAFVPASVLLAAGVYQATRAKEVCLTHCQSPMGFVMRHWRSGRIGALRMGLRHSLYCLGCCWLFMLVLFVAGSMSLVWMGVLSLVIFGEKVGTRQLAFSRGVGAVLFILGTVVAIRAAVGG